MAAPSDSDLLLVENNPSDVYLMQEAFRSSRSGSRMHVVEDGSQALAFLRREPPFASAPRPDLVLLDLNLPRQDGLSVLEEMKADPELRKIPVIVLTTSTAEADVDRCYELNANCYIAKPVDFEEFERVIREIDSFWLHCVTLPRGA
jgi:chemotaxis family two-component system response regulator Rcp1